MNYMIIDILNGCVVNCYVNEDVARTDLYTLRKKRYMKDHPNAPTWEYDTIKIDNGYNLYKIKATLVA